MILLDEDLNDPAIIAQLRWHTGSVGAITDHDAFPSGLPDAQVFQRLREFRGAVFVTRNRSDFWRVFDGDPHFCVIALDCHKDPVEIGKLVRAVLSLVDFQTRRSRSGIIARVRRSGRLEYYRRRSQGVTELRFEWE